MGYRGCHFLVVKLNAWSGVHHQEQVVQYRPNHIVPGVGILFPLCFNSILLKSLL